MLPKRTIAALVASAALTGGLALAAPDMPEAAQEAPVIIIELLPPDGSAPGAAAPSEQEQAIMTMLLLQLLMGGLQIEAESPDVQPIAGPVKGQSI